MKVLIKIFIGFTLIFCSCENKNNDVFNFGEIENPEITSPTVDSLTVGKKGFAITTASGLWPERVSVLKAHWFYTWGDGYYEDLIPNNIEFVPMKWGQWNVNEAFLSSMKALKEAGKINYLLGFNEPDGAEQANMSVDKAIELWPILEEVGLPLGSPACVNSTGDWMQEFMQKANTNNLRVDFVTVHWYGGVSASSFINRLEETYSLYGKPIWITEFAPADWTASSPEDNKFNSEKVLNFMKEVLPQLEDLDYVHRYTWFSFGKNSAAGTYSALFNLDGTLTELGQFYADYKPNLDIELKN
ncbi:glycoside hydrolase family protein [Lutibacter sp. A80]|uniref:glycoside hydrolase family protein n=1 Tax=Lutibacter sp. A80 TaxID=2918453 RepID=UPI001F063B50|nr:glycoside hydrolase family protein [Lutibacter sp. A80]UMB60278.1 glycoside hydrolase family protein [Lutibacter sp. A80]